MTIEKPLIGSVLSAEFYEKGLPLVIDSEFVNFTIESKFLPAYNLTFYSLYANYKNGHKKYISQVK